MDLKVDCLGFASKNSKLNNGIYVFYPTLQENNGFLMSFLTYFQQPK